MRPAAARPSAERLAERRPVQISDIGADNEHIGREAASKGFIRTILGVPLLREGEAIGAFGLSRQRVEPFSDTQIDLVRPSPTRRSSPSRIRGCSTSCARAPTSLTRSVEELRALGETSQAVNSTLDLEMVLNTIVTKAVQLSGTEAGAIYVFDEGQREFRLRATYGMDQALIDALGNAHIGIDEQNIAVLLANREPVQVADLSRSARSPVDDIVLARRLSRAAGGAAVQRRRYRRPSGRSPAHARRFPAKYRRSDEDLRGAVGAGDSERAAVPRDRGERPAARSREPAQVAVPRQYEPRAAHAAQRHPRLYRTHPRQHLRRGAGEDARGARAGADQRQASARTDQRRARSVEDRGRPAHAVAVRLFGRRAGAGRLSSRSSRWRRRRVSR